MKVLAIDDDAGLRSLLREYLAAHDVTVEEAEDGAQGLSRLREGASAFDVVLLDVMLPGEDGFSLLPKLRAASSTPIIMLTARGDDDDRVRGLELGADDYLAKPFNPKELLLRMRAVLRRAQPLSAPVGQGPVAFSALEVFTDAQEVKYLGERLELTSFEFRVLLTLTQRAGEAVRREELAVAVGMDEGYDPSVDRSLDVHISRLRQKLTATAARATSDEGHVQIKTVRGIGYALARSL